MRITERELESMILYEDKSILVCHKPSFLAVETRNPRQQDLVNLLKNRRAAKGEEPYIGIIHRLDQPVEGLLVFALTKKAAATLSAQVRDHMLTKEYYAVVCGVPEKSEDTLIHYLIRDGKTNISKTVSSADTDAKEARLSYTVLATADVQTDKRPHLQPDDQGHKNSLLRISLDTGRHHQIRVQFAAIGHPLLGDSKYGGYPYPATGSANLPLALCACHLMFTHPDTGQPAEFCVQPMGTGFSGFEACF